jgi:hypothetical protein
MSINDVLMSTVGLVNVADNMPELSVVALDCTIDPTVVLNVTVLLAKAVPLSVVSKTVSSMLSSDLVSNTSGEIIIDVGV